MWLSFALLILVATLFVIFADEFVNVLKKYWKIPLFKLLAPLIVASFFFLQLELVVTLIFNKIKVVLFGIEHAIVALLPQTKWMVKVVEVAIILFFTIAPVVIINRWYYYCYKTKKISNPYYISLLIWLSLATIYVSGIHFS